MGLEASAAQAGADDQSEEDWRTQFGKQGHDSSHYTQSQQGLWDEPINSCRTRPECFARI